MAFPMIPEGEDDYYRLLGINPKSSQDEIKAVYRRIVMELHPDRNPQSATDPERLSLFSKCSAAYAVLTDPTNRALYDLVSGYSKNTPQELARIAALKKSDALRKLELMQATVQTKLSEELHKGGLIIEKALYGDLRRVNYRSYDEEDEEDVEPTFEFAGAFIDVTVQVQFLVEESKLIIHGGSNTPKSFYPGFYDPSDQLDDTAENFLYVRYRFRDRVHEVTVGEHDNLHAPLRAHVVPVGANWVGPVVEDYQERRKTILGVRRQKKRSQQAAWVLAIGSVLVFGFLFVKVKSKPHGSVLNWLRSIFHASSSSSSINSTSQPALPSTQINPESTLANAN
eukprot:GILJ01006104.1.p1 GENE.GILJ01006104.1~~GILJ01006104.1.p1  ORF type:complete len:356 (-),score=61.24 GILJ01006104.1:205-1224(-)